MIRTAGTFTGSSMPAMAVAGSFPGDARFQTSRARIRLFLLQHLGLELKPVGQATVKVFRK